MSTEPTRDVHQANLIELFSVQEQRFQSVVPHLFRTPFLRGSLQSAGVTPTRLTSLRDLAEVPFITKDDLRRVPPEARSPFGLGDLEYFFTSSGTTGEPTVYFWTRRDTEILREAGRRAMERVGVRDDDVATVLAPMGMPIMWYCMIQQFHASGAGVVPLGVPPPSVILDFLASLPVSIMITLPVVATRLYEYALTQWSGERQHLKLRQVQVAGDFLTEPRRRRIESMWGCNCYNLFGMSELFGPIAGECSEKRGMHVLADYVYVEVLDPSTHRPVDPGQPGVAVYTSLWDKGTPLLRYWSDDHVRIDPSPCPCGELMPRLEFLGRPADMAVVDGVRLFASQIEERVLDLPVGNEYYVELTRRDEARLVVESLPNVAVPIEEVRERLRALLPRPVEVSSVAPGTIPRDKPKPRRIVDLRRS